MFPPIYNVPLTAPFQWLRLGWRDFRYDPTTSTFYGMCFAVLGMVLAIVLRYAVEYFAGLLSGFLLVGPFLSLGLYEASRRRERNLRGLPATLTAWRANLGNMGLFAGVLAVIMLVWARASVVVTALFFPDRMPAIEEMVVQLFSFENLDLIEFVVVFTAAGLFFAALVFTFSVVAMPMMLDRNTDAITAMIVSFATVSKNVPVMVLWGTLIAGITIVGFLTLMIGIVILVPVLGHASWHAYRALLGPDPPKPDKKDGATPGADAAGGTDSASQN
ncbi:MAG: DUF2189 domain-containing protein [Rhodocyclaceae bacterium]|nr:DUF2189 domain-containing protein [Rhodocyclaceae bacterium]MBX3666783.1 DUF2189 domain-containing protein [Rhodocyclaceae bacterium]